MRKVDEKHPDYRPKRFISNGIGKGYLTDKTMLYKHRFRGDKTTVTYDLNGYELPLPAYYKRKLWNDDERASKNIICFLLCTSCHNFEQKYICAMV